MSFKVQILGSSSAIPTKSRNQTGVLLSFPNQSILFDVGEGIQKQLTIHEVKPFSISHIVISHLHPDHFIGLIGLLCSWGLLGRSKKVDVVAPKGLDEIIAVQLKHAGIILPYEITFHLPGSNNGDLVLEEKRFTLHSYRLKHRVDCYGYLLQEQHREQSLLIDKLEDKGLPYEAYRLLKQKKDYTDHSGQVFKWSDYTKPPPRGVSFAFFTDTSPMPELCDQLPEIDLLYHDATFDDYLKEKAFKTGHSTALQAAEFARMSGAKKLLLGHFSTRYGNLDILKDEAQTVFKESYLATEGSIFTVNT